MCWWEDEDVEPWEHSGPNGQTLIDAQQEFLADQRPYRQRPGKVRAPRKKEARDPDWRPLQLTEGLLEQAERARLERERLWEEEARRVEQEIAADPDGPFKEYNAAIGSLQAEVSHISHRELKARFRQISRAHDMPWSRAHLELWPRLMSNEDYYRHRPIRALWWTLRYARPGTYRQRWEEARTGTVRFGVLGE